MVTQIRRIFAALAIGLLIASPAWAQRPQRIQQRAQQLPGQVQPNQAQPRTALRPVDGSQVETSADREIATWLVLSNELEVRLAKIAAKQAHGDNIKQFAETVSETHGNLVDQFRKFAPDAPALSGADKSAAQPSQARTTAQEPSAQRGLPVDQVCRQMAERKLKELTQEFSKKQGSEFDMVFVGSQIHEHATMLDVLEILRQYASPQLQTVIDQAIPTTKQHLADVRKIGAELWGRPTEQAQTGNRDEREEKTERQNQQDKK